jgi:uncharacterized membrane protein
MTLKQYQMAKAFVAMAIAIITAQSVIVSNYFLPVIAVAIGLSVLIWLKRRLKEIIADERDFQIGGRAALWTVQIYAGFASILAFILFAQRATNPSFEAVAAVLAYSACFLMIAYSVLFKYFQSYAGTKRGWIKIAIVAMIFAILVIIGARLFSGEDDWICSNGQWVKHGNPSFPAPQLECK